MDFTIRSFILTGTCGCKNIFGFMRAAKSFKEFKICGVVVKINAPSRIIGRRN